MGRELLIDRIDFMKDGHVIIRSCPDYYICGRYDFTNAVASLFYNKEVNYLIVDYDKGPIPASEHVRVDGDNYSEKEFDMVFDNVSMKVIEDICNKYIEEDNVELARENAMLNDAYEARRNTRTVKDFNDFSDLIDNLQEHIDTYCEQAKIYKKYIKQLNLCHADDVENSYILLTLSE